MPYRPARSCPFAFTISCHLFIEEPCIIITDVYKRQSYARVKSEFIDYQNRLRGIDKNNKKATKSGNKLNRSLRDTKKAAKGAQMGIARMLGTSILFSFVFQTISAVMTGIREGFENLAQYSDDTNKALSMLMSSMTRLKNSFATAFSPLLEYVAPALTKFIDLLAESATWVAQLFAALSGKDTYVRAVKVEEDYAASLKDSNKELEKREKENEKVTLDVYKRQNTYSVEPDARRRAS